MGENKKDVKFDVEGLFKRFASQLTKNSALAIGAGSTLVILTLLLLTELGRQIINIVGYVVVIMGVIYAGSTFTKRLMEEAKRVPTERKIINDISPEPTDTEPDVPDDSVEYNLDVVAMMMKEEKERMQIDEAYHKNDEPKISQVTIDEVLEDQIEKNNHNEIV